MPQGPTAVALMTHIPKPYILETVLSHVRKAETYNKRDTAHPKVYIEIATKQEASFS